MAELSQTLQEILDLGVVRELLIADQSRFMPARGERQRLEVIAGIEQLLQRLLSETQERFSDSLAYDDPLSSGSLNYLKTIQAGSTRAIASAATAYENLKRIFAERSMLLEAKDIMGWLQQSEVMPEAMKAIDRSYSITDLFAHRSIARRDMKTQMQQWLTVAQSELTLLPESEDRQKDLRNLSLMKMMWTAAAGLDDTLITEFSNATTDSYNIWKVAKKAADGQGKEGDFASWLPSLERVVEATRKRAIALAAATGEPDRYQALLNERNPGLDDRQVTETFAQMSTRLEPLIAQIRMLQGNKSLEDKIAQGDILEIKLPDGQDLSEEQQFKITQRVMKDFGLDPSFSRLDKAPHPFSGGTLDDIRLTTRAGGVDMLTTLIGLVHESGHGFYDHGLPHQDARQPVNHTAGMWVHETQSLSLEKQIALSKSFMRYMERVFNEELGLTGPAFSADNLYALVTHVEPSLIRVAADEVTYPIHVFLRHDLERRMLLDPNDKSYEENKTQKGYLAPADLPRAWNEAMQEMLGVQVPSDAKGCMQDVHWSSGIFGSFPGYTYGALGAAQLAEAMEKDLDVARLVEGGQFGPIREWLKQKIHSKGARYPGLELVEMATGSALSPEAWFRRVQQRYGVSEIGQAASASGENVKSWGGRTGNRPLMEAPIPVKPAPERNKEAGDLQL